LARTNKLSNGEEAAKESELTGDKPLVKDTPPGAARRHAERSQPDPSETPAGEETAGGYSGDADESINAEDSDAAPGENGETTGKSDKSDADPVAALQTELAAERDKYLRLMAEYDNYRKRTAKEREMIYNDARADVITRLLPVYDNLERAMKTECADEAFYKGIEMTMTQLTDIFKNLGMTFISAVGEVFDPNRHNAVMTIENPELGEKVVAEEYQKGLMLGDKVIRFSTVVVAN